MEAVTLGLAIAAIVMSILALGWNVISWVRSGPHVKVKLHVTQHPTTRHFAAFVYNEGRSPVDVLLVLLKREGQSEDDPLVSLGEEDPGLPYRLEPGSSVVLTSDVMLGGPYGSAKWYQARVELGNGRVVEGRREDELWTVPD